MSGDGLGYAAMKTRLSGATNIWLAGSNAVRYEHSLNYYFSACSLQKGNTSHRNCSPPNLTQENHVCLSRKW